MEIAEQDKLILIIQDEIANKKKEMMENYKHIKKTAKVNHFLNDVLEDYHSYYDYICKEKREQQEYLQMILDYLDKLLLNEQMASDSLEHAHREQGRILEQISLIKRELDEITAITGTESKNIEESGSKPVSSENVQTSSVGTDDITSDLSELIDLSDDSDDDRIIEFE